MQKQAILIWRVDLELVACVNTSKYGGGRTALYEMVHHHYQEDKEIPSTFLTILILRFFIMLIQGQLKRQVGIVLNKSCTLKAARFFETAASNMPVAFSSCPNCRPSQVKQCPQLNTWAECNKRVGSFEVHVGEFVDTPSLSWNFFFVWWRSCCLDARGCRVKLRILVSRNSILSLHELYEM